VAPPQPSASDPGPGGGIRIGLTVTGLLGLGVLAGLTPMGVREARRRRRSHLVDLGGPQAVSAAWEEVLAESADRGVVPPVGETVRARAQRLVHKHGLDEPGRTGLGLLVGAVEQSWYAGGSHPGGTAPTGAKHGSADRDLRAAMDAVLASMARNAPLTWTTRVLPRSVLPRAWQRQDG
ncbi:MAG: hypothetical protein ACRDRA_00605, partial [Pseudonocardiaceae bacterium]